MKSFKYGEETNAIAITKDGKHIEFDGEDGWVIADYYPLKSIVVSENVHRIDCMYCGLPELYIPQRVRTLECQGNNFKELKLPPNLFRISCDKDLFIYDECKAEMVDIYYQEE